MPHEFAKNLAKHKREEHGITRLKESLKQIVYGANDGIATTFAVVSGFAGAQTENIAGIGGIAVLIFGIANLFSDGAAMGLGEYLSARSQGAVYKGERKKEILEIKNNPNSEELEAYSLLLARGVKDEDAKTIAALIRKNPEFMADFMMNYEFGLADPEEENPITNGIITFISFVIFGSIPLIPYLLLDASPSTFKISLAMTFSAMAMLGLLRRHATGETAFSAVAQTLCVGAICALIAYIVGAMVGSLA